MKTCKRVLSFVGKPVAALSLAVALSPVAARATDYYWCGSAESNVLDKANWYLNEALTQPANAVPGVGDVIYVARNLADESRSAEMRIAFDDKTIPLLSQVKSLCPRMGETIIDVSTNVDITAAIFQYGSSTVIKRGAGAVYLKATEKSSYQEKWRVEKGEVYCPTNLLTETTYFIGKIDVWEGARFWIYPGASTTYVADGICGPGTIAKEWASGIKGVLQTTGNAAAVPFSGYLTGNFNLHPGGNTYLTGVTNDFNSGIYYRGGVLGFRKYSGETGSSLGAGSTRSQTYSTDITLRCLATAEDGPQTTSTGSI